MAYRLARKARTWFLCLADLVPTYAEHLLQYGFREIRDGLALDAKSNVFVRRITGIYIYHYDINLMSKTVVRYADVLAPSMSQIKIDKKIKRTPSSGLEK